MSSRQLDLVLPAGHTIAVTISGSGRPVMLVHGFPLDATIWRKQTEPLVERGFQVIAPDLRGFGNSSPIAGHVSLADFADDLEHVRSVVAADWQLSIVGLSMGGYIAFEYWKRYGKSLERIVFTNTKPSADKEEAKAGRLAMAEKALQSTTWDAVSPMLEKLLSPRTMEHDLETTQWVKTMMSRVPPQTIAAAQRAMAERRDFTTELAAIQTPTLVITGQHDPISPPPENKTWSAQLPNAKLEVIPSAGHLPQVENADAFNEALMRFL